MTQRRQFSRRDFSLLAANLGVVTMFAGIAIPHRSALAQTKTVLGHFGSANPQTFAKATGAFQDAFGSDVAVDFYTVSAGPQVIAAMSGGSLDICNIGSSPMVVAFGNGLPLSMVYIEKVITDSECLAVRKSAGIHKLEDLAGRKIGLPFNTSVHFAMLAALHTVGMDAGDVELINMKPDSIAATWSRGDIDASYIWYPVLSDLLNDGGELLYTSGDLQEHGTLVFDGIVVRNEFKDQHPELVQAYLERYDQLVQLYRDNPEKVVETLAPFLSMPEDKAWAYVNSFHGIAPEEMASEKWMGLPGMSDTGLFKTLRDQAEFLKAAEQLREVPESFEPYVDRTFLAKMVGA